MNHHAVPSEASEDRSALRRLALAAVCAAAATLCAAPAIAG